MSERRDALVEIGTEELPPKALRTLELAFAAGVSSRLRAAGLLDGELQSFASPRRLALRIPRLAVQAPAQLVRRRGPPLRAAFDAAGAPTRAAEAFATSCGVGLADLTRELDAKGTEYLAFEGLKAGATSAMLLPLAVQEALAELPIPKRMRWGAGEAQFVRPVHWVLMLYGQEPVAAQVLGVAAGVTSQGHRFMAPRALRIRSAGTYERTLERRGRVLASFERRRERIRGAVEARALALGGKAILPAALLDEVTGLVEWPVAIAGQFEPRFLALPREVLLSTLQEHQRYFALEGAAGELLPWFITVSNLESPEPQLVQAGNERVVRPRLADAAFFWEQDRRTPLAAHRAGLEAVTFQAQLGSLGARTERLAALAGAVASAIGAPADAVARAAQLCKCDLLTAMVGEFPDLQGIMGRHYALADGEPALVAEAIRDHYLPRAAGDGLPGSGVGAALALADKLDVLAGIFVIGQKPSGTRDPFGLRRAAIGLTRIILEHRLVLDLPALLEQAVQLQPGAGTSSPAGTVAGELYDYILERLRSQLLEGAGDSGVTTESFDAVLATRPHSLLDFDARLRALVAFLRRAEAATLAAANRRIANILRKAPERAGLPAHWEPPGVGAEAALHAALEALRAQVQAAIDAGDYARALDLLASLGPAIDAFFAGVLVNDPDERVRRNRLGLLQQVRTLFCGIADFSCLPG